MPKAHYTGEYIDHVRALGEKMQAQRAAAREKAKQRYGEQWREKYDLARAKKRIAGKGLRASDRVFALGGVGV